MLSELQIKDFAIIDHINLKIDQGLVTFTGETGAGKSIIIDAVELLLGGRAEVAMIRSGAEQAFIEATFKIPNSNREQIISLLEREELLDDPDYLTIGREIRSGGRSVARLNGRNVNSSLLREIGSFLVDVHGQSEHLSLLRVKEHLNLLDRYANHQELLEEYTKIHRQLSGVRHELIDLQKSESEAVRKIDMLDYQINEIQAARLSPGEEEILVAEHTRLANAETLVSITQQALINLDEGTSETPSATDLVGQILESLEELGRLDDSLLGMMQSVQSSFSALTELSKELRAYIESVEFNPDRLNQVEERLELIANLKRKYGDSVPEILEFLQNAEEDKETITHAGERIEKLKVLEAELLSQLGELAQQISLKRHQAAAVMESEVIKELTELNMPGAQFKVDFNDKLDPEGIPASDGRRLAFDSKGFDRIEFLIAPNPGEGLKPLVKIASGGETSRLMLALKNVLARADNVATLIFDEIDQGIGGRVGTVVGHKLWLLSRHHQVLCVTHLPQLAAFGEQHIQVTKQIQNKRTITVVNDLDREARLYELAQMLGETSDGTINTAREMVETATGIMNSLQE
jgi:DNA repair protein RecN (Recombination protein N)